MSSTKICVDDKVQNRLRELAGRMGVSMQQVVADAVEEYERKLFWEDVNIEYVVLRNDPKAWKQELAERAAWDATSAHRLRTTRMRTRRFKA